MEVLSSGLGKHGINGEVEEDRFQFGVISYQQKSFF